MRCARVSRLGGIAHGKRGRQAPPSDGPLHAKPLSPERECCCRRLRCAARPATTHFPTRRQGCWLAPVAGSGKSSWPPGPPCPLLLSCWLSVGAKGRGGRGRPGRWRACCCSISMIPAEYTYLLAVLLRVWMYITLRRTYGTLHDTNTSSARGSTCALHYHLYRYALGFRAT